MKGITVKCAEGQEELNDVFKIRETVFINEQNVAREEEMDEFDKTAVHVIAYYNEEVAGCARIRFLENKSKLERIAVLPEFRKKGIGKKIVEFLVSYSKKKGVAEAIMHAQIYANDFYLKCGFLPRGAEFMEAGIRHIEMFRKTGAA